MGIFNDKVTDEIDPEIEGRPREAEAASELQKLCEKANERRGECEFYFDPDCKLGLPDEGWIAVCQIDVDWPRLWVTPNQISTEFLLCIEKMFTLGIECGIRTGVARARRDMREALGIGPLGS